MILGEKKGTTDEYNLYRKHVQYKYAFMITEQQSVDFESAALNAFLHDIFMTDISLERSKNNEYF